MKSTEIAERLEKFIPVELQFSWDNSGWQVKIEVEVKKLLLALDPSLDILREAVEKDAQMIVTHHPLIYKGTKAIDAYTFPGNVVAESIRHGIPIYSVHTNLDVSEYGPSAWALRKMGARVYDPIIVTKFVRYAYVELLFYTDFEEKLKRLLEGYGIKSYKRYLSKDGTECKVEFRTLDTVVEDFIRTARRTCPEGLLYVDYTPEKGYAKAYGLGRIGEFDKEIPWSEFKEKLTATYGTRDMKLVGTAPQAVKKLAIFGGHPHEVWREIKEPIDVYVVGEMTYHEALAVKVSGIPTVIVGHFASEKVALEAIARILQEEIGVPAEISSRESEPTVPF